MKKRYIAFLVIIVMALASCGGRLPDPKTSQKVIKKYFKKYGKKYPGTIFGQGVTKVEIDKQTEIHKKFVAVDAYIVLTDGNLRKILASLEKGPFGWKFSSWEDATGL